MRLITSKVHLEGSLVAQCLMGPVLVVEPEVVPQPLHAREHIRIFLEIDFLVLDGAPQSFDEDVVEGSAFAVHADPDAGAKEHACEFTAGELRALIGIEDLRPADCQRFLESLKAEVHVQGDRNRPGEHIAAEPVHDGHKVDEPTAHPDVGDITCPHLTGSDDRHVPEKIGKDFVLVISPAQFGFGIDRLEAHGAHHAPNPFVIDDMALLSKPKLHAPESVERSPGVLLIEQAHDREILLRDPARPVVPARAVEPEQLALPDNRKGGVVGLDQPALVFKRPVQTFF